MKFLKQAVFAACILFAAYWTSSRYFQLLLIQGDSMRPAYHSMQLTVLNKYDRNYTYGDVLAFSCEGLEAVLVKRVAAVPGDTVQIVDGTLYVNDKVSTVYPDTGIFAFAGTAEQKLHLGEGQFFVIGDNIAKSKDSRYEEVGAVHISDVSGKIIGAARSEDK